MNTTRNATVSIVLLVWATLSCWALTPNEYAKGENVCHRTGGRRNIEICREAVSRQELDAARQQGLVMSREASDYRRRAARLDACSFSVFSDWQGEIQRLDKKLKTVLSTRSYARAAVSEGYSDLAKQRYLPSDVVAAARHKVEFFSGLVEDQDREIAGIEWCMECAQRRVAGSKNCD